MDTNFAKFRVGRPIPADPAKTTYIEAGPLTIGIEYRFLNEEILTATYGQDRAKEMMIEQYGLEAFENRAEDQGVSIHVFDAATRQESLRFDDLDSNKHYHYMRSGDGSHAVVPFDPVANGSFLPWVFKSLRSNVRGMLSLVGADSVASSLDETSFLEGLIEAERLVSALFPQMETI